MIQIMDNLFIGSDRDCSNCGTDFHVIHACKTCHQRGVGYLINLSCAHPNYLTMEQEKHLYLNMVDMDRELLPKFTHPIMTSAIRFIKKHITQKQILIHCNLGRSRSPSIGLVYLAREKVIASGSYSEAKTAFYEIHSHYMPGRGITLYLNNNWQELMSNEMNIEGGA